MRKVLVAMLLVLVGATLTPPAIADDVPDSARADFDQARTLLAAGDAKRAYTAISKSKDHSPSSVDYWHLYVRIWRALGKPEKVLWERIVDKRAAQEPRSAAFLLLRARLAKDEAERRRHLDAAVAKDPKTVEGRLAIARLHLAEARDARAQELLDAVLADHPGHPEALALKGEMMLAVGRAREAADFAKQTLAKHDLASLHHLRARALAILGKSDPEALKEAVVAARAAVERQSDPEYVRTLVGLLDETGDLAGATAVLEKSHKETPSPALAAMLGELAFRAGKYLIAGRQLAEGAASNPAYAKAAALAYARRGQAQDARAMLAKIPPGTENAAGFGASVELLLGDPAAALARLEGKQEQHADWWRAIALARQGKVEEVAAIVGREAKDASRAAEDWWMVLAEARLFAQLDKRAASLLLRWTEARANAGKEEVPPPQPPEKFEAFFQATSQTFMGRFVTYWRAANGDFFRSQGGQPGALIIDGKPYFGWLITAAADCPAEPRRVFLFNMVLIEKEDIEITFPSEAPWRAAEAAARGAAEAAVRGDLPAAAEGFGKAVEQEPLWARARVLAAVARAGAADADLGTLAKEATEAAASTPDDIAARWLAILLRALANENVSDDLNALARTSESFAERRMDRL